MSDLTPSHLRGSVFDFSQLKRPSAPVDARGTSSVAASQNAGAQTGTDDFDPTQPIPVPSLVFEANLQNLPDLLQLSSLVPILVDVFTNRTPISQALSDKLAAETLKRNGEFLLLRLDGDGNPQVLKAFQVEHLPSVTALLKGQSIPLFAGDQPEDVITNVVDRMLAVAKDNGVVGTVVVDAEVAAALPEEPELPPKHQAAFDLIDQGDYDGAIKQYQSILAESPADQLAVSGLAQVQLLKRVDGLDFAAIASSQPATAEEAKTKSDVFAVHGNFNEAFKVILDYFETAEKAERDVLREHLLDLFKVAPVEDPAVAQARIRLANLLF